LDPAQVVINFVARQLCVAVVGDTAQQAQGCTDKAWHSGCAQWLHLNQARSDTIQKKAGDVKETLKDAADAAKKRL